MALLPSLPAFLPDHHGRDADLRVELDSFRFCCFHLSVFPFPVSPLFLSYINPEDGLKQSEET